MDQKLPYDIETISSIPGATQVVDWFGQWPTFHDAYLVDVVLSTWQPCLLRLHVSKGPGGSFIYDNEGMITFYIEPPSHYEIEGTRPGGQLLGLTIYEHPSGCEILMEGDVINGVLVTRAISRIELSIWPPE
jgi:hypothetical protein